MDNQAEPASCFLPSLRFGNQAAEFTDEVNVFDSDSLRSSDIVMNIAS